VQIHRPSLRRDLAIRPIHRKGRRFIELCDPATGARLWLSDLGYSVAFLMDGGELDDLIARAREALHIELAHKRLLKFAERLASFGLLVGSPPLRQAASPVAGAAEADAPIADEGPATLIDGPSAAAPVAAPAPAAAAPQPGGDTTLALSPIERDILLRDALERGAMRTVDRPPAEAAPAPHRARPQPERAAAAGRPAAPPPLPRRSMADRARTRPRTGGSTRPNVRLPGVGAAARRDDRAPAADGAIDALDSAVLTRIRWP
jgi:hypothetical protein